MLAGQVVQVQGLAVIAAIQNMLLWIMVCLLTVILATLRKR
jgi:hypothetical protein